MQTPGTGSTLNPFGSILQAAQHVGLQPPKATCNYTPVLNSITGLVEAASARYTALSKVQSLRAQKEAPPAADFLTQQELCKLLRAANTNNHTIVQGQQEIAARVRALKSKECIPVERQHQAEFLALLRAIFGSGPMLQQLYENIAWAINTTETGAIWEDRLQPLLIAMATCQAYEACLNQQDQLISRLYPVVTRQAPSAP